MFKKIIYMFVLVFFVTSCGDTVSSVKKGLTGTKSNTTDEFLVRKKDPLILPPNYENLPTPEERVVATEEYLIFENTLETSTEDKTSTSSSIEDSVIKKIQSK